MIRICFLYLLILAGTKAPAQVILRKEPVSIKTIRLNDSGSLIGATFLHAYELIVSKLDSTWSINLSSDRGGIKCFEFSTAEFIAAGTYNGNILVWNLNTGALLHTAPAHERQVTDLKFTRDNNFILACSSDKKISILNLKTGKWSTISHTAMLDAIELHPASEDLFVTGDHDGQVITWDLKLGKKVKSFKAHESYILDIRFIGQTDSLITASHDTSIKIWNLTDQKPLREFNGHTRAICSVDIYPKAKSLVSGSLDKTIRVWDIQTGKLIKTYSAHKDYVNIVRYLPDGSVLSGSRDGTLRYWK